MKYRIVLSRHKGSYWIWSLRISDGTWICESSEAFLSTFDAIADARRFAELLRVEVEIDA